MAINIGDNYIDSDDVVSRLNELREARDELVFLVYRVRTDETIDTFNSKDAADNFVDTEDFDPERVKVRITSRGLDDDDEEELNELKTINDDGNAAFGDWGEISVKRLSEVDAEEYGQEYISDNYSTRNNDAYQAVKNYVNFESLGENLLDDRETGDIGGYTYIDL